MIDDVAILLEHARTLRADGRVRAAADATDLAARTDRARALPLLRELLDQLAFEDEDGIRWRYVPGGNYRMGDDLGDLDERPARDVDVNGFFMSEAPLALEEHNSDLRALSPGLNDVFRLNAVYMMGPQPRPLAERTPLVACTWQMATEIARAVNGRLPTEIEWERAARGCLQDAQYPWGDDAPTPARATFAVLKASASRLCAPNDYGLFAMAGNVWEWCSDVYDALAYARARAPDVAAAGAAPHADTDVAGINRVIRGGSFLDAPEALRVSFRASCRASTTSPNIGIRVVRDAHE